ncbi:MAG: hypothetical protein Q7R90_01995 [bacterium]|nr:hypothetical protein [bacterium]
MISLRSGAAASLAASLLLLTVSLPLWAHAQTASQSKPVVVATVNIYDAKILGQEGSTFTISFDLTNREGAQSGIRYAVELLDQQQTAVDEVVYDDVTNLESNSHIIKNIRYAAPGYLSGTYQMRLVSKNASGLVLAHASLGAVTLSGTGSYVEILAPSCFLTVAGEAADKKYSLDQGVDVAASEALGLTCTVENHSQSAVTLEPSFETFYRDVFGQQIATPEPPQKAVSVSAGGSVTFTIVLPKASEPQAYDVKFSFTNPLNVPSNSITAHYVLRGASATIQNLTLDKASYAAGDTALISIFWTGPASNFFDARSAPGFISAVQAVVSITGSAGPCGDDVTTSLDPQRSTQAIPYPISGACDSPKVSMRLADGAGNVLASSSFDFQSTVPPEKAAGDNTFVYVILAFLVLALLYGIYRIFVGRAGGAALVLIGLCVLSYGLPGAVHADTFTQDVYLISSGGWQMSVPVYYNVNLNKSAFAPGETITAAGKVRSAACGNSLLGSVTATINAQHKDVFRSVLVVQGPHTYHVEATISSNTFTAETAPGNYVARFYPELHVPHSGPGSGSFFSVDAGGDDTDDRWGGVMMRDWIGQTPYEMPYTISGACIPGPRTCRGNGNLQDNCGGETVCPNGCSTATNQCNTSCVPGPRTCQTNGNLRDNCGVITTCQYGCSTATNECKTLEQCTPSNVCNDAGTKVVNKCDRTHVIEDCAAQGMRCVSGQCVGDAIDFVPFDAFDWTGAAFTATGHLQAIPSLVHAGQTTRIYWKVTNTRGCTVTGSSGDEWSGPSSGTSGKTSRGINGQITYTLECQALPGATPATIRESVIVNMIPIFEEQ